MSLAMKAFFRAIAAAFKTPAPAQSLAGLMGPGYENISLTAPFATQCGAGWPAVNGHGISWYGIGCRRVRANSLHGCHAASRRTDSRLVVTGWVGIHLVTSSALRTPHSPSALRPPQLPAPRSPLPASCGSFLGVSDSFATALWGNGTPVFNYLSDPSGANTVKYLAPMSVAQKGGFTWAGQTFGRIFELDGRPMGQEDIQMVQCDTGAQTCAVDVSRRAWLTSRSWCF
ncbi:hypothetical protein B0H14DRAFT_3851803 [Mycena olivaceomarginata]|nr:hypothetical protein B0H14DRAFT_3851803 [Mycena olivaceomarginata]